MNTLWDDILAILKRPVVKLAILIVISLGLCGIYAAERDGGPIHVLQNACRTVCTPLSSAGIGVKASMSVLSDKIFDNFADGETLSELKEENARLKTQIIANEKYKQEAERLQALLNIKDQYQAQGIGAHVIGVSGNAWNQTITIDVGSEDGVNAGQTVLGRNGVVGQVDSVNLYSATVRLLSDPNSGVAVRILTSGADCILKGSLDGVLYLEALDVEQGVNVGDIIVTSGLGGSYVEGIVIGSVSQIISGDSGVNRKIVVNPIERNSTVTEVFVIQETN